MVHQFKVGLLAETLLGLEGIVTLRSLPLIVPIVLVDHRLKVGLLLLVTVVELLLMVRTPLLDATLVAPDHLICNEFCTVLPST